MKIVTEETLAYSSRVLRFSKQELATLENAARIAEEARAMIREERGSDAEDGEVYILLGAIEHNSSEIGDRVILSQQVRT